MNVAVKSIGMFNKLNIPIIGVIENMSYLKCHNCNEKIHILKKAGGGIKISDQFKVPYIGKMPLTTQIMKGSDTGTSVIISEPTSEYAQAFYKI